MDVINFFFQTIKAVVTSFFSYPVIGDVTFGWFCLAAAVIAVLIDFLFRRMIK